MKKSIKKEMIVRILLVLIVVSIPLLINMAFFSPTKLNAFIASKVYKAPANSAFTDENFYKCVVDEYNDKNNTSIAYTIALTDDQLQTITYLRCHGKKIVSTDGLEKLKALKTLELGKNQLTSLNISDNQSLEQLRVNDNQLTVLDVNNNSKLQYLSIINNQIANLDISKNPSLKKLYAYENKLTNLDVSKNLDLEHLYVYNNQLTSLDVSKNLDLEHLYVYNNQLTSLDVSNNTMLKSLYAYDNMLTTLTLGKNIELTNLEIYNNFLTNVDLSTCTSLSNLEIYKNRLTNLDVSNNSALEALGAADNELTILDISNNEVLENLSLSNNQLTSLDINNISTLKNLYASNNQLISLDISGSPELIELKVSENQMNTLNIGDTPALRNLDVSNNQLTNLNISNAPVLRSLYADNNQLTSLDVSNAPMITTLYAYNNQLTNLNVSKSLNLNWLDVSHNQLINLDVSNNTTLKQLKVHDNQLTGLDVSNNLFLETLYVDIRRLVTLDLSQNSKLSDISVSHMIYRYIADNIQLSNYVKLPSHIEITNNWKSYSPHIASVNNNGVVITLDTGIVNIVNRNDNYTIDSVLNIIEITSNKYSINNDKNYIYIGTDLINENIIDNFTIPENISLDITSDNKLQVKYNEEILKEFTLVNISSEVYDLTKNYIYVGNNQLDLTKINVINGTVTEEDNQLKVKYNHEIVHSINISKIDSQSYVFFSDNIFIGNSKLDIEKTNLINFENGVLINEDKKLKVKYRDKIIYEYSILSIDFKDLRVNSDIIVITEDISYEDFISNVTPNGVIYKIFDKEDEVTGGIVTKGMVLKIYKDDEEIYEYQITDEYLEFDESLNIDDENNIIFKLKEGMKVSDILSYISTSGEVKIKNKAGNIIANDDIIGTGYKIEVVLSSGTQEYTLVISGDVTGDAIVNIADVLKIADHTISNNILTDYELYAAEVTNDTNLNIADVLKIADYTLDKRIEIWR